MSYKKFYEGGWQSGETGGTPITPEALNHMEQGIADAAPMEYAKKVGASHNLLDNSDFRNPVNQRGKTSYTAIGAEQYTIDRWDMNGNIESVTLTDNGIHITAKSASHGFFRSYLESKLLFGKTLTFAVKLSDGNIFLCTGAYPSSNPTSQVIVAEKAGTPINILITAQTNKATVQIRVNSGDSATFEWVALYEGEYTAETLPEYQPKGYAAELLECQRYYQVHGGVSVHGITNGNSTSLITVFSMFCPMRATPSLTVNSFSWARGGGVNITALPSYTISAYSNSPAAPAYNLNFGSAIAIPGCTVCGLLGSFILSADL